MNPTSLNIALLTYRGHPHVGGQGVYVHYLSKALRDLDHHVTVFSGPPYPDIAEGVSFVKVPSLDLYRPEDPFRRPARTEFRDYIDVAEYALMCTAAFPEPLTFSLRVARMLKGFPSFDVIHDNQGLGYGLLSVARRTPTIATVHHPIPIDKSIDLAGATTIRRRLALRRWYSFVRMQRRVVQRLPRVITVSESAVVDTIRELGVSRDRTSVVHNGVDTDLFRPLDIPKSPGRIITVASSSNPIKGLRFLIEAVAKLRTEREVELVIVGKGSKTPEVRHLVHEYDVADAVTCKGVVDALTLVELYATSEVAVVASLYEGFSFPAIQAMACGVPLVATTAGALPEVVGPNGDAALTVAPGDAGAIADRIGRLLDEPVVAAKLAEAGRRRALRRFTWAAAARATAAEYQAAIDAC